MKFNIGVDIEQVSRFKKKDERLIKKMFSKKELRNMRNYNSQRFSGMFSAKEAVIKACNPILKLRLQDIEIMHRRDGSPYALIKKSYTTKIKDLKISISHTNEFAVAVAILLIK